VIHVAIAYDDQCQFYYRLWKSRTHYSYHGYSLRSHIDRVTLVEREESEKRGKEKKKEIEKVKKE
jgi:hypothetical protein